MRNYCTEHRMYKLYKHSTPLYCVYLFSVEMSDLESPLHGDSDLPLAAASVLPLVAPLPIH